MASPSYRAGTTSGPKNCFSCYEDDVHFDSELVASMNTVTHLACQAACRWNAECYFFAFNKVTQECSLQTGQVRRRGNMDYISGLSNCV